MNAGKAVIRNVLMQALQNGELRDLEEYLESQIDSLPALPEENSRIEIIEHSRKQFLVRYKTWVKDQQDLLHIEKCISLSEYLKIFMKVHIRDIEAIGQESGIGKDSAQHILHDVKSIIDLPIASIVALTKYLGLSLQQALELIEKSLRLGFLSSLQIDGMARYKKEDDSQNKFRSLRKAREELLLKASSHKRFKIERNLSEVDQLIKKRLSEFKAEYE